MKKIISMLCAATLFATILAGCGGGGGDTSSSETSSTEDASSDASSEDSGSGSSGDIKVGFVVKSLADQYWILVKAGAEAAAEENGVDLTFIAPNSESDVAKQVENIETLIAAGVDVLCIAPSNDETVLPALQNAVDAGIKIIAVDTDSSLEDKVCFIGTGNEAAAKEGALWAGEQVGEGAKAIVLRGRLGDATHDAREAGIEAGLEESGVEILEVQAADSTEEKGMSVSENLLQKYDDVDLIITTADSMATGAVNAVEAAGKDTLVYGFDGTLPVAEKVENGEVLGTTAQHPYEMGVLGVETAIKIMNGEEVDEVIDSGQEVVNSDNAADFIADLESKVGAAE
ncbi:MAG: sugar ABC transporter substrate-binding protein [Ruminococcus sp.]|jgi:ribose transport system substrate-binding protein